MDISGARAIVTGGAAGIGRACAIALAKKGAASVALIDVDQAGLVESAMQVEQAGARVVSLIADVSDYGELETAFKQVQADTGGYTIVFNNAGIMSGEPAFPETTPDKIKAVVSVNLLGVMFGTRLGLQSMSESGGGVIINTASQASFGPMPNDPFYSSTKAAVVNFTLGCAHFAQSCGVRVNAILPGVVDTPILKKTGDGKNVAQWLKPMLEVIHHIKPEEIADAFISVIEDDTMAGELLYVQNAAQAGATPTLVRLKDNAAFHGIAGG